MSPPSVDRATTAGSGKPPRPTLRNATLQTYTLPKNGLEAALSAQMVSLSEKSAEFCLETITGCSQAFLSPAAAATGSSVRDTAIASKPLNAASLRSALKLTARLA